VLLGVLILWVLMVGFSNLDIKTLPFVSDKLPVAREPHDGDQPEQDDKVCLARDHDRLFFSMAEVETKLFNAHSRPAPNTSRDRSTEQFLDVDE